MSSQLRKSRRVCVCLCVNACDVFLSARLVLRKALSFFIFLCLFSLFLSINCFFFCVTESVFSSPSILYGCYCGFPSCSFLFSSPLLLHTPLPLLCCVVGKCCSGRQTDSGRVLQTTFLLLAPPFLLHCFFPPPLSSHTDVHEKKMLTSYMRTVHKSVMSSLMLDNLCMWHVKVYPH